MTSVRALLSELIAHRELGLALAHREIVVRYKRSVFGMFWVLAEPLFTTFVMVILFGVILKANHDIPNYPYFVLFGLLPWLFVSTTLEQCGATMLEHAPLLRKVYFPRELVIIAVVISRASSMLLGLVVGLACAFVPAFAQESPRLDHLLLLPLGVLLSAMLALGLGLFLAAVQVVLQDAVFLVKFALRLAFYGTPIVYSANALPHTLRPFFEMNPLVGILYFCQAGVTSGIPTPSLPSLVSAAVFPVVALVAGWWGFRRLAPLVSDLL